MERELRQRCLCFLLPLILVFLRQVKCREFGKRTISCRKREDALLGVVCLAIVIIVKWKMDESVLFVSNNQNSAIINMHCGRKKKYLFSFTSDVSIIQKNKGEKNTNN